MNFIYIVHVIFRHISQSTATLSYIKTVYQPRLARSSFWELEVYPTIISPTRHHQHVASQCKSMYV